MNNAQIVTSAAQFRHLFDGMKDVSVDDVNQVIQYRNNYRLVITPFSALLDYLAKVDVLGGGIEILCHMYSDWGEGEACSYYGRQEKVIFG